MRAKNDRESRSVGWILAGALRRSAAHEAVAQPGELAGLLARQRVARGAPVRCFQPRLAPTNASSDPRKITGQRWPQPSMAGPFRQVYLDVKREQSIEQLGLAIKMMLAEPAARNLFAAVLE